MIRLYPEQLRAQLNEGLRAAYLLLGNDPLLLQESLDAVRHAAAAQQGFDEHHTVQVDNNHRLERPLLTLSGDEPVCIAPDNPDPAAGERP